MTKELVEALKVTCIGALFIGTVLGTLATLAYIETHCPLLDDVTLGIGVSAAIGLVCYWTGSVVMYCREVLK